MVRSHLLSAPVPTEGGAGSNADATLYILQVLLDQDFSDLDGVERGTFPDIIRNDP